ncbi:MAG: HIT domain-containing protein [Bacteroidales bacterium]|nr:HIT domain-containing protein [Bacteroidales bacterium]
MASIFSRIVAGEIPSWKVAEDEHYYAFLDINPLAEGHTLVIPKKEVDYIFDLDAETYAGLWQFAGRVAKAVREAVPCKRVGVAVLGMEVPHAHIHLVPLQSEADLDFRKEKKQLSPERFAEIAAAIAAAFNKQ